MRARLLGVMLVFGACAPPDAPPQTHREADLSTHRRAVFLTLDPDDGYAPAFAEHREGLETLRTRAAARSGLAQPDLERVRSVAIPPTWTDAEARAWAAGLDAQWVVLRLGPVHPPADLDPPTPSYVDGQGYADALRVVDGISGAGVAIHEVEYGWRATHEDLVDVDLHPEPGQAVAEAVFDMGLAPDHGTASVGMLVAPHNGYGIDGLVPDAQLYTYPEWTEEGGLRRAEAVAAAVAAAEPGDVVMLQMQAQHPGTGQLAPAEIEPDVWMLTRMATDAGVLVVAAAGNGSLDLDGPDAEAHRALGDSGAILVGAGDPDDRAPMSFSSYGRRVDLQGWGSSVFTLGYGDYARLGEDDDQAYTDGFEGTSAALPMVAAAAASVIEGFVSAEGMPPEPADVRRLLAATGRPQPGGRHVGPLPDIAEALAWVGKREDQAPVVELAAPADDLEVTIDLADVAEISVEVAVDDASPIHRVQLEVDGVLEPNFDESAPFELAVSLEEGAHTLRARAVDAWGNVGLSAPRLVTATVEDKPVGSSSSGGEAGETSSGSTGGSAGGAGEDGGASGCTVVPIEHTGRSWWLLIVWAWISRRRRSRRVGAARTSPHVPRKPSVPPGRKRH